MHKCVVMHVIYIYIHIHIHNSQCNSYLLLLVTPPKRRRLWMLLMVWWVQVVMGMGGMMLTFILTSTIHERYIGDLPWVGYEDWWGDVSVHLNFNITSTIRALYVADLPWVGYGDGWGDVFTFMLTSTVRACYVGDVPCDSKAGTQALDRGWRSLKEYLPKTLATKSKPGPVNQSLWQYT